MKIIVLFLFFSQSSLAQPVIIGLDKNSIPKTVQYKGNLIQAVRWTDKKGDNIVILSSTLRKPIKKKNDPTDDSFFDAELQAQHYIVLGDSTKQTWNIYEGGTCPGDFYLYFIDSTFEVTDLNKDGNAEVWIMYDASCDYARDPFSTNIIMYEGSIKYSLLGENKVKDPSSGYAGWTYTLDDNFKNGEVLFRQYAENLWMRTKTEKKH